MHLPRENEGWEARKSINAQVLHTNPHQHTWPWPDRSWYRDQIDEKAYGYRNLLKTWPWPEIEPPTVWQTQVKTTVSPSSGQVNMQWKNTKYKKWRSRIKHRCGIELTKKFYWQEERLERQDCKSWSGPTWTLYTKEGTRGQAGDLQ